jgi:hypothetical protein
MRGVHLRYKSGTPQSDLIFKVQVRYTSVRDDHLRYNLATHWGELSTNSFKLNVIFNRENKHADVWRLVLIV